MLRRTIPALALIATLAPAAPARAESVGTFEVDPATSASLIQGNASSVDSAWLNTVNAAISVNEAFSGPGIIEDGIANFGTDWIFQIDFAGGVLNDAGDDLAIFDARFDAGSYFISSSFDGFATEASVLADAFVDTGLDRAYFFGGSGPFGAGVFGAGFDLSDLGVTDGGSIGSIRIRSGNASMADLLGVGAITVPEPALSLLVGAAAALVLRRRR